MQKPHFVAQGAALSKVMLVSIVVNWRCAAPRALLWCGVGALCLATRRARVRPLLACRLCCVSAAVLKYRYRRSETRSSALRYALSNVERVTVRVPCTVPRAVRDL